MQRSRGRVARRGKRMKRIPGEAVRDWFNSQPREPWENRVIRDILIRFRNRLKSKPRQWGSPISDRRYPVGHLQPAKEAVENKLIPLTTGQPDDQELKKLSPILKQLSEWRAVNELQGKQKSYLWTLEIQGKMLQGHITIDFGDLAGAASNDDAYLPARVEIHTEEGDLMNYPVSKRLELFDSILQTLEPPEEKEPTLAWEASTVRVPRDFEKQKFGRKKAEQKYLTEYIGGLPSNMQEIFQGGTLTISLDLTAEEAKVEHGLRVLMEGGYLKTLEETQELDTTLPAINDPKVLKIQSQNEKWKDRTGFAITPADLARACGLEAKDRGRGSQEYHQGEVYRLLQSLDKYRKHWFTWYIRSKDKRDTLKGIAPPITRIDWYRQGDPKPGEFTDDLKAGKLQHMMIYPTPVFLYRLNDNFDRLPSNLYSEIKRLSGGQGSKYAGLFVHYLHGRAGDIFRAGRKRGIEDPYTDPAWTDQWTIKISKWKGDPGLAEKLLMDSYVKERKWKRIDDILKNECFRVAGEMKILQGWKAVKGITKDNLVALTLNPLAFKAIKEGVDSGREGLLIVRQE